jgi:putative CocE/NonD family hydrolase
MLGPALRRGPALAALVGIVAGLALQGAVRAAPAPGQAAAATWSPDPARYGVAETTDLPITMADGRILRATLHEPTDPATGRRAAGPFPVIVWLTPYGKTVSAAIDDRLVARGYLGVAVDVGGTGGSEGASQLFGPVEAGDSKEVVAWAAALPRSSGAVGMSGGSYLGITQLFAAAEVGPGSPLKAIFPIAAAADPYRDLFTSGGIVNVESGLGLLGAYAGTRTLTPLAERPTDQLDAARLVVEHGLQAVPFEVRTLLDVLLDGDRRYDGPYWQARAPQNVLQRIVDNGVAVHLVGGMFDVFQRGTPLLYAGLQNAAAGRPVTAPMAADQRASGRYQLLYGPWHHGNQGEGADLVRLQLQWFDHWLKGRATGIADTTTPLHVVEPGGRRYDVAAYPVESAPPTRLHLAPGGRLLPGVPGPAAADHLAFTGIAANPCSRSSQQWSAGLVPEALCGAQRRPADPLPTELAWTTSPLDRPMTVAGPIGLHLRAASSAREVMWTVRLEDVAPDGSAVELSAGALLGTLRAVDPARSWPGGPGGWLLPHHPLTEASRLPVTPGAWIPYDLEVRPVFATLAAGHRLRVVVGSADVPHLLPPLRAGLALPGGIATIGYDPSAPSFLDVPVRG